MLSLLPSVEPRLLGSKASGTMLGLIDWRDLARYRGCGTNDIFISSLAAGCGVGGGSPGVTRRDCSRGIPSGSSVAVLFGVILIIIFRTTRENIPKSSRIYTVVGVVVCWGPLGIYMNNFVCTCRNVTPIVRDGAISTSIKHTLTLIGYGYWLGFELQRS